MIHQSTAVLVSGASILEDLYATPPAENRSPAALFVGSSVGTIAAEYLRTLIPSELWISILDVGRFDLMGHLAGAPAIHRNSVLRRGQVPFGGKSTLWGSSAPRPHDEALSRWPYDRAMLEERFLSYERRLGVTDVTPLSDRELSARVRARLAEEFPWAVVRPAPLAINRDGRRWAAVDAIPALVEKGGVSIHPRLRCTRLRRRGNRIVAVEALHAEKEPVLLRPRVVVLAAGAEGAIPLVRQVANQPLAIEAADHHRIDMHGRLPADHYGAFDNAEHAGIAVLFMEYTSSRGIPAHFEIKIAARELWRRGYMQSADNLRGDDDERTLYVQIQCVSAMARRLPNRDLINLSQPLVPVMHREDAVLHAELVEQCLSIARVLGLDDPGICLRPLLTNHHAYGAFRVGKTVTSEFRFAELENLYILPPSAYLDDDDDANPMLKSLVLSSFAMDAVARDLMVQA